VGGGIEARDASLFAAAVTVARNSVSSSGNVATSLGGGIRQDGSGVTLRATILAANTTPDSSDGPNCSGTVGTDGDNLLGALAGCTFTPFASDHPNVAAPGLGTLAPNGGPTQTISLQATSPAVDAIRAARCPAHKDQRGVKRPQGPRCDVGAFERST
jgi:hypothetical protein